MDYYERGGLATARLPGLSGPGLRSCRNGCCIRRLPSTSRRRSNAGPDGTITFRPPAPRNGIARDDGLPGSGLTTTWSKISGREDSAGGTVVFANPNAAGTTATFGADGIYVLRLTASDGAVTVSDDVTITVNPAPPNSAPVVNAGADDARCLLP